MTQLTFKTLSGESISIAVNSIGLITANDDRHEVTVFSGKHASIALTPPGYQQAWHLASQIDAAKTATDEQTCPVDAYAVTTYTNDHPVPEAAAMRLIHGR